MTIQCAQVAFIGAVKVGSSSVTGANDATSVIEFDEDDKLMHVTDKASKRVVLVPLSNISYFIPKKAAPALVQTFPKK